MISAGKITHIEEADYLEAPTYGVKARRDTRSSELPPGHIPFDPTHMVKIEFRDITFRTNVKAKTRSEAKAKALLNLRYTFWPESRLKAVGPILSMEVYGP